MGARQAADRGGERGPTNRRLPSAAPEKAPQWQTRRQGAHVGGGGGGKRGRREPCREPRFNPALVGIGSVLEKSGRACASAPSHQPVPSAHPMERAGRGGGEGENGGGPWRSPCRERPWSVLRKTERPRPYDPQTWIPRAGWVGPLTLPCTTGPHPPEKRGFSHQFRVRFFPTHHHYRETKDRPTSEQERGPDSRRPATRAPAPPTPPQAPQGPIRVAQTSGPESAGSRARSYGS